MLCEVRCSTYDISFAIAGSTLRTTSTVTMSSFIRNPTQGTTLRKSFSAINRFETREQGYAVQYPFEIWAGATIVDSCGFARVIDFETGLMHSRSFSTATDRWSMLIEIKSR